MTPAATLEALEQALTDIDRELWRENFTTAHPAMQALTRLRAALATATAEAASLRAEVEAKDKALKQIAEHPAMTLVPHYFGPPTRWALAWRNNFEIVRGIARTALARAATAGEG